jgi:hypothetical protein
MGGACSTRGEMRNSYSILTGNLKGIDHSEHLGVQGKIIIIKYILGKQGGRVVDWMYLIQDRDQWRGLVNTVMNLRFPQKAGNFLTS